MTSDEGDLVDDFKVLSLSSFISHWLSRDDGGDKISQRNLVEKFQCQFLSPYCFTSTSLSSDAGDMTYAENPRMRNYKVVCLSFVFRLKG